MTDYPLYWRVKVVRPEWFGRRCRIVIHGGGANKVGNRLIEFEDGSRVVCPGAYLRRAKSPHTPSSIAEGKLTGVTA